MAGSKDAGATPDNVAGQATQTNALDRHGLSLLGLFGPADDLNALLRLPGGQTRTVKPGSRVPAGQIVAIDEKGVVLNKHGKTQRIGMPGS